MKDITIKLVPIKTATALTLAFFFAKITGYINWSWWLVFAPLWIGTALVLTFILAALGFLAFGFVFVLVVEWLKR